jgi:hypothetical protein
VQVSSGYTSMVKTRTLSILLATVLLTTTLSSCGGPLSLLTGGGPNVAANTQIGKENNQGINTSVDNSVRPVLKPEGPVETIVQDNSTTKNTEVDPLLLLLLVLGWLAPSPQEIGRGILKLLGRRD